MAFTATHLQGDMDNPPIEGLSALLDELDSADDEHPDVSISDETGWTLSAYRSGKILYENVEDDNIAPRHLDNVPRREILRLMRELAEGNPELLELVNWKAGY